MTMQVGMVGKDGVLLAGDTRWRDPLLLRGTYWQEGNVGTNSTKIKIDYERKMAISCAADMTTAGYIANEITSKFDDDDLSHPIAAIQRIAATVRPQDRNDAQCLILLPGPCPRLLSFKSMKSVIQGGVPVLQWSPVCREEKSIAIAGHLVNAALFWVEKYYDKTLSIKRLVPLAAHLIVCAHQLNPYGISGLGTC